MIIGSTGSVIIGLTWGGVAYPWSSIQVIAPLVVGTCGLAVAITYELLWAKTPTVRDYRHLAVNIANVWRTDSS